MISNPFTIQIKTLPFASLSLLTELSYLGSCITALGSQFVDLRFSNISPLLCLIQLMLYLTELAQIGISLFFLKFTQNSICEN